MKLQQALKGSYSFYIINDAIW